MNNKFLDYFLSIGGGTSGSIFGVIKYNNSILEIITFETVIETVIIAAIFAIIGGILGFFVARILNKIFKQ